MPGKNESTDTELADDLVVGAAAIARYLGMTRRQIYAHAERGNLPYFKLGATICLRKSTFLRWMSEKETMSLGKGDLRLILPDP